MSTRAPEQLRDEAREQYEMGMQASYNSGIDKGLAEGIAKGKLELAQNLLAQGVAPVVINEAADFDDRAMSHLLEALESERAAKQDHDDVERFIDSECFEMEVRARDRQNKLYAAKSLLTQEVPLEKIKIAFGFNDRTMVELQEHNDF